MFYENEGEIFTCARDLLLKKQIEAKSQAKIGKASGKLAIQSRSPTKLSQETSGNGARPEDRC
jgi:hypothetical protein